MSIESSLAWSSQLDMPLSCFLSIDCVHDPGVRDSVVDSGSLMPDSEVGAQREGLKCPHFAVSVACRRLDLVVLPVYVLYPDLPSAYAAADHFVHPAREERWGVSVAEVLACGLPAVASSRVGAASDLVKPGGNGAGYPAGDAAALVAAIEQALAAAPGRVREASATKLPGFGIEATWRGLVAAAGRAAGGVRG